MTLTFVYDFNAKYPTKKRKLIFIITKLFFAFKKKWFSALNRYTCLFADDQGYVEGSYSLEIGMRSAIRKLSCWR